MSLLLQVYIVGIKKNLRLFETRGVYSVEIILFEEF